MRCCRPAASIDESVPAPIDGGPDFLLFLANDGTTRQRALFDGTVLNGGAWSQPERRVPLAYLTKSTKTLAGARTRGTMIPLESTLALAAFPALPPVSSARPAVTGDDLEDFQ